MDRFTRGFLAGIIAAMIQFVVGLILYYLNLTELLWQNFAAVMIYGREAKFLGERVFAELGVWFFSGIMGILFAYLLTKVGSRDHLLKGFVFAEAVWFGTFAITLLFNVPEFKVITLKASIANFVLSAIWGVFTAEILRRLDHRVDIR